MYRELYPVEAASKVSGRYILRRVKKDSGLVVEERVINNVITNGYFDQMLQGRAFPKGFVVGAGTSTPLITDTSLQSYIGGGASPQEYYTTINSTVFPRYIRRGFRVRSAEGATAGNISEVGIYFGGGFGDLGPAPERPLASRARIVDELGNPTTITVASDEFLDLIFEWTYYAMDGLTGTMTINLLGTPTDFDYEVRPVCMNAPSCWARFTAGWPNNALSAIPYATNSNLGSCRVSSSSTFEDPSSASNPAQSTDGNNWFSGLNSGPYTPGSRTRLFTLTLPLNSGNYAAPGIRSFLLGQGDGSIGCSQMHRIVLDGPFLKLPTHVFTLPINISMSNA